MVEIAEKPAKAAKARNYVSLSNSSSSFSSSSSSSSALQDINCAPPVLRNGSIRNNQFLLNPDEQIAFKKYMMEIKQISGLNLLKCGLGVQ